MWFSSPLWLTALIPWGGVTLWLLWGRFDRAQVPYLELWRGAIEERPSRPGIRRPPVPLLLAIASMLLAVIAAARPAIWGNAQAAPLLVVLDCGATMSASSGSDPRFRATVARFAAEVVKRSPVLPVRLVVVPDHTDKIIQARELTRAVESLPQTGLRTGPLLSRAVSEALRSSDGLVFVVSDQPVELASSRIIRIAPEARLEDFGISRIAARQTPAAQVMVRIFNRSHEKSTTLDVVTAAQRIRQTIQLPPIGGARDYFFSPRELGETVEASLLALGQNSSAAGEAWLTRASVWPILEPRVPLDPSLERMVGVYTRRRLPSNGSPTILIVGNESELATSQAGVIVAQSFADSPAQGALEVADQSITRGINWGSLPLIPTSGAPPLGWEPLVRCGSKTLVAAQSDPVRKVWIGFATDQWAAQTQFVILWTNVFDWIAQAGRHFAAYPLEERTADWKPITGRENYPGIYRREDGVERAFNASLDPEAPAESSSSQWQASLVSEARRHGAYSVAPPVSVASLLCLLCGLMTWRRSAQT